VVVDGQIAFLGGLDLNNDDWDDRDHRADNPDRADSGRGSHSPYHDIQAWLTGPAAEELSRYFQQRWQAAGQQPFALLPPTDVLHMKAGLPLHAYKVALSRNQPKVSQNSTMVMEIRDLYADAIAAANQLIYIENQYFSGHDVEEALVGRMQAADRPLLDIVLILPKQYPSWLETTALEPPRLRVLEHLAAAARQTGHRLGVYYSATTAADGSEVATLIHSKLLLVDDRFLTVGSANASNRSMGLDTELNISWETLSPKDGLATSIRQVRVNLLAEHCGLLQHGAIPRELGKRKGLVSYLDSLADTNTGRLRRLSPQAILQDNQWVGPLARWGFSLGPEKPTVEGML
jgi:phospholipase D1/2